MHVDKQQTLRANVMSNNRHIYSTISQLCSFIFVKSYVFLNLFLAICDKFELLTFQRKCRNTIAVWRKYYRVWLGGGINSFFSGEQILKIGQDLKSFHHNFGSVLF